MSKQRRLAVVLVEDNATVRKALRIAIGTIDGVDVVGEYDDDGATDSIAAARPDVVVMDIALRGSNCFGVMRGIVGKLPDTNLFIFSNHSDPQIRKAFIDAGVHGFFDKFFEGGDLISAIRAVRERQVAGAAQIRALAADQDAA